MAIELGSQFKSVAGHGPAWIVQRILSAPGMIPHAILTQNGDSTAIRTLSIKALEDRSLFRPANDVAPAATAIGGRTVRGFRRIATKAA